MLVLDPRWGYLIAGFCLATGIVLVAAGLFAARTKKSTLGFVGIAGIIMLGLGAIIFFMMR